MSKGVLAIFSNIETSSYETLKAFTSHHEIPFITLTHPIHEYSYLFENDKSMPGPASSGFGYDSSDDPYESNTNNRLTSSAPVSSSSLPSSWTTYGAARTNEGTNSGVSSKESFLLNMHPDLVPLLVSMIKYNRWKNIYYVYDHEEALNRLEGLFEYQIKDTDFHTNILVRKLDDVKNARVILKPISELKDTGERGGTFDPYKRNQKNEITFFLDLRTNESYARVFETVKALGMNTSRYHYFLNTLVNIKMCFFLCEYRNYKILNFILMFLIIK